MTGATDTLNLHEVPSAVSRLIISAGRESSSWSKQCDCFTLKHYVASRVLLREAAGISMQEALVSPSTIAKNKVPPCNKVALHFCKPV